MKVDHVLILAAGQGTRMGDIGKELPKVLWPVFEKSILELEIIYAKKLAPQASIFINCFNYKDKILSATTELKKEYDFEVLNEPIKLDIGGGVHNLAKKLDYQGNLLIINSDQFLFFNSNLIDMALKHLKTSDSVLFSYQVNSSDMYNALDIEDNYLKGIIKNSQLKRNTNVYTYTGMSLIKLDNLIRIEGESKFFETVANPKSSQVRVLNISDFEYWDFGTTQRYYDSMFEILKSLDHNTEISKFLNESKGILQDKVGLNGYHSESGINLAPRYIPHCYRSIVLGDTTLDISTEKAEIIRHNLRQSV